MNSIQSSPVIASLSVLALAAPLLMGCAVDAEDPLDEQTAEAEQALTCTDLSCNGVNPYATTCVLDQINKGSGTVIVDGGQIGTITLYYSPTCHAVWGYVGYNKPHGLFTVCVENESTGAAQCGTGGSQTFSQVSPMLFLPVGQRSYALTDVQVNFDVYGALTTFFTRTF